MLGTVLTHFTSFLLTPFVCFGFHCTVELNLQISRLMKFLFCYCLLTLNWLVIMILTKPRSSIYFNNHEDRLGLSGTSAQSILQNPLGVKPTNLVDNLGTFAALFVYLTLHLGICCRSFTSAITASISQAMDVSWPILALNTSWESLSIDKP